MADNLLPFAEPTPQNKFAEWTANLKHITRHCHDINTVKSDNYIGYTQVPLTLAGPLFVQGQYEEATIIAPLATTDRTLVANVDRGCKLLQACEGVGSDASMGVANDGSVQVSMGAVLSDQGCRDSLHVSTAGLHRALRAIVDSVTSASRASIVTAIFIATGQNIANVKESCKGYLSTKCNERTHDLTLSMFFSSLRVDTVGGGTEYPTQKEALEMLGCQGPDRKYSLAEAIAAFCLAGEVGKAAEFAKNGRGAGQRGLERGKL